MKLNCVIIDDDEFYGLFISKYLSKHKEIHLLASFNNPVEAIQFIAKNEVDIIITDVRMPGITGIELIRSLKQPPLVIFISSYPDFALDAFEINAVDYLKKPLNEERLEIAIKKAKEIFDIKNKKATSFKPSNFSVEDDYLLVKQENHFNRVKYSEILFIEAMLDFIKIVCTSKQYLISGTLKSFEEELPKTIFIRTQRSYIVNETKINAFNTNEIKILSYSIPIGISYRDAVLERISTKQKAN